MKGGMKDRRKDKKEEGAGGFRRERRGKGGRMKGAWVDSKIEGRR